MRAKCFRCMGILLGSSVGFLVNMDSEQNILSETPDLEFSENQMEQETPDLDFSDINAIEMSDTVFSENAVNTNRERFTAEDEEDIDDLDEPDQYIDEDEDTENANNEAAKTNNSESAVSNKRKIEQRLIQLPTARIKHIMKADPEVSLITGECTFLVTKATELFIESLAREAFLHTAQSKKKTVQKRDVDAAIENVEALMFLEGMMNF